MPTRGATFAGMSVANMAYLGLNCEAFPIALFAAGFAGKPFVPLNYRLPDTDLRRVIARTPFVKVQAAVELGRERLRVQSEPMDAVVPPSPN